MLSRQHVVELGLLAGILIVAACFRWTGLAWDNGYLFHPDERQIILVVSRIQLPANPLEVLNPDSPLNPKFFAYGSLPLYLLRLLLPFAPPSNIFGPWEDDQLASWVLFGRWLSGLFDLGTIVLTYTLGRRVYGARVGLIAAALLAVTVLNIQLAHFYAVDTPLTFFTIGTLYFAFLMAQQNELGQADGSEQSRDARKILGSYKLWTGVFLGLALATKVTAFPLIVPVLYACYRADDAPPWRWSRAGIRAVWGRVRPSFLRVVGVALVVFVVTQPYALIDWYNFGRDVVREALVARGWLDYPYTRQYAGSVPFAYQVTQGAIWGMGLPLGIFAWGGGLLFLTQWWKTRERRDTFLLLFAMSYLITLSFQYTKYLRYLMPLLPVLYILAVCAWGRLLARRPVVFATLTSLVLVLSSIYAFSFTQIYMREHPWLTASRWIYENIDEGRTIAIEEWDDALPTLIRFDKEDRRATQYTQLALPTYEDDTDAKRAELAQMLSRADAVVVASQRSYGSIRKLPERYPMTNRYYEALFNGELGFEPQMTARNDLVLGGIVIRDDPFAGLGLETTRVNALLDDAGRQVWNWGPADESFSVYDHPQPIVFVKMRELNPQEMEALLQ
ncbi:MAG: glycosyltransferase family 39 protein [Anaerolineae bacterium]|nr:glycosyltransferase family 39 protein [Anaerolineae bacterium]